MSENPIPEELPVQTERIKQEGNETQDAWGKARVVPAEEFLNTVMNRFRPPKGPEGRPRYDRPVVFVAYDIKTEEVVMVAACNFAAETIQDILQFCKNRPITGEEIFRDEILERYPKIRKGPHKFMHDLVMRACFVGEPDPQPVPERWEAVLKANEPELSLLTQLGGGQRSKGHDGWRRTFEVSATRSFTETSPTKNGLESRWTRQVNAKVEVVNESLQLKGIGGHLEVKRIGDCRVIDGQNRSLLEAPGHIVQILEEIDLVRPTGHSRAEEKKRFATLRSEYREKGLPRRVAKRRALAAMSMALAAMREQDRKDLEKWEQERQAFIDRWAPEVNVIEVDNSRLDYLSRLVSESRG